MRSLSTAVRCVLVLGLVLAVYRQTFRFPFIMLDDPDYILDNPVVMDGLGWRGLAWAFAEFHAANWHPLAWLSHMLDVSLFGPEPGWHHLVNVLLHGVNSILLLTTMEKATGEKWTSFFVSALFAVHPLHVESVAWVAERKDLLCGLFWFLTIRCYLAYVERRTVARYLAMLASFALGLLSKPMIVTLPFVLLLLDYWPLRRIAPPDPPPGGGVPTLPTILAEKVPLLLLSAASSAVTVLAQSSGGNMIVPPGLYDWAARLSNAVVSYALYLRDAAWPAALAIFYPAHWTISARLPTSLVVGAIVTFGASTALAIRYGRRWRWLPVGWFWYVGTLVPVIGLVQVGVQARADRYTYVPLVGIFLIAVQGAAAAARKWYLRKEAVGAAGGVVLVMLSSVAWAQVRHWRSSEALFLHSAAVAENNWPCMINLGIDARNRGDDAKSAEYFRRSLDCFPSNPMAWLDLGIAYSRLGRADEAETCFRNVLDLDPANPKAHYNLAVALYGRKRHEEALPHFIEYLRANPSDAFALRMVEVLRRP